MGQKVHPLGFRLGFTQKHSSQWYAKSKSYSSLIIEDNYIRKIFTDKFKDAGIVLINIERKVDQIKIEICAARPRIIVNFGGQDLEVLRQEISEKLIQFRKKYISTKQLNALKLEFDSKNDSILQSVDSSQISIHVNKLLNPNTSASFAADFLVEQLEKRIAFRRALKSTIQRAQRAEIKGIKIQISGRLNGAEIARSEWVRKGRVPLQTLKANVEYSYQTAKTIYGLLGIKVWVFQGFQEQKLSLLPIEKKMNILLEEN